MSSIISLIGFQAYTHIWHDKQTKLFAHISPALSKFYEIFRLQSFINSNLNMGDSAQVVIPYNHKVGSRNCNRKNLFVSRKGHYELII